MVKFEFPAEADEGEGGEEELVEEGHHYNNLFWPDMLCCVIVAEAECRDHQANDRKFEIFSPDRNIVFEK